MRWQWPPNITYRQLKSHTITYIYLHCSSMWCLWKEKLNGKYSFFITYLANISLVVANFGVKIVYNKRGFYSKSLPLVDLCVFLSSTGSKRKRSAHVHKMKRLWVYFWMADTQVSHRNHGYSIYPLYKYNATCFTLFNGCILSNVPYLSIGNAAAVRVP